METIGTTLATLLLSLMITGDLFMASVDRAVRAPLMPAETTVLLQAVEAVV